ncbi:HAD family hydrolase [Streptantibioticus silvisoli]|uniref:HAD family phosphatase n=1 Tax=Streptantibioticus silvisoli TaxID=2705255 RepID=A0ABT6W4I4_9ACTN|nr:HAD family phosphatase [Streptantibioticus silvisoli]MDI5965626.1 HAD family phosphatase [Streptantibioticus silvisoli]
MQGEAGTGLDVEAVVFDMDGVLIDSRPVIENAWRDVARRHGRTLDSAEVEGYVHGRTGAETVRMLFPEHSDAARKAIWAEVDAVEEEAAYSVVPGADAIAARLAQFGVPLVLVTSSWQRKIENALGRLGLLTLFPEVVTRDDVERGKPHPDPYLMAARRLGMDPARMLVFEDSVSGVASAVAAGALCVGIGGGELLAAGAVATTVDFTALSTRSAEGLSAEGLSTEAAGAAGSGRSGSDVLLDGLDVPIRVVVREVSGRHA